MPRHTPFGKMLEKAKMTVRERLESNREITEDGHWLWLGGVDAYGYGQISIDCKMMKVHRVAYRLYKAVDLDNDVMVLHKPPCLIRNCFCPDHLYLGDAKQNCKDMIDAGRKFKYSEASHHQKFIEKERKFLESIEKQVMDGFKE
jgi:hypothetical protein